ncbi:hypothetical protein ZWY2020_006780 [Hordeum vulgare]|nr:hypothetical protein ZWY2020_006780 [Hordeum vulgare]
MKGSRRHPATSLCRHCHYRCHLWIFCSHHERLPCVSPWSAQERKRIPAAAITMGYARERQRVEWLEEGGARLMPISLAGATLGLPTTARLLLAFLLPVAYATCHPDDLQARQGFAGKINRRTLQQQQ